MSPPPWDRPVRQATIVGINPIKAWGEGATSGGTEVRIPGTLPAEVVTYRCAHLAKDGTHYGQLEEVCTPSPERIPVACPKFLECGGCDYLHVTEEAEHRLKRERVAQALQQPLDSVAPVVPSPNQLQYRAIAKWVVGPNGELGSYAPRSHRVVDMKGCQVHVPIIETIGDHLRQGMAEHLSVDGIRYIVLRAALPHEAIHATIVARNEDCPSISSLGQHLSKLSAVAEIWLHTNTLESNAIFSADGVTRCLYQRRSAVSLVGSTEQHLASGAFALVNPGAAERLYALVAQLADSQGQAVLDLYAGSGGISLTLAEHGAAFVMGVERSPIAIEAAQRAGAQFGQQLQFVARSAEEIESILESSATEPFSIWVVNPPRKGLASEVLQALKRYQPTRVIYVSCQPDSLARDLHQLRTTYRISHIQPVDMFPRTRHVETIVRLELTTSN